MGAARYISLSEADNKELREVENNKGLNDKVRLRAKVLRLSNLGMNTQEIAVYTGRHLSTITRDFDRWEAKGLNGLVDGVGSGQPSPVAKAEQAFRITKLYKIAPKTSFVSHQGSTNLWVNHLLIVMFFYKQLA